MVRCSVFVQNTPQTSLDLQYNIYVKNYDKDN